MNKCLIVSTLERTFYYNVLALDNLVIVSPFHKLGDDKT